MDFRAIPSAQDSLGLRHNNPGNIRPGDNWLGMAGTDGGFVVFSDVTYGIRAQAKNLYTAYYVHGRKTLTDFINAYAPKSDGNDPVAYAASISAATGIGVNDDMNLNTVTVAAILRAMMNVELTPAYSAMISDDDLAQGIAMVGQFQIGVMKAEGVIVQNPRASIVVIGTITVILSAYLYYVIKKVKK